MIVLVDIGNTRTKYLVEKGNASSERIVIENSQITMRWLNEHWSGAAQVIIGSVKVGPITEIIEHWADTHKVNLTFIESEKKRFGITNSYSKPNTLGVDRWLTFIGASTLFPKLGVIIIDAGTATTVDVIDAHGEHQGGWILSGVDLLLSYLDSNTSKVKFEISNTTSVDFGKSTSECVNNAAWASTIAMINLGIKEAESKYQVKYCIILGGNAEKLVPHIISKSSKIEVIHDLIFTGLKRYIV